MFYSIAFYCILSYCIVLFPIVLYCVLFCCILIYCIVFYSIVSNIFYSILSLFLHPHITENVTYLECISIPVKLGYKDLGLNLNMNQTFNKMSFVLIETVCVCVVSVSREPSVIEKLLQRGALLGNFS